MMKKAKAWVASLVILQLLAFSLLGNISQLAAAQAADYTYINVDSSIRDVQVDSGDNSVWVLWYETPVGSSQLTQVYLSHFNLQGQLLRRYDLPTLNPFKIGLVEQAGVARYYLAEAAQTEYPLNVTQVGYVDLNDGQFHQLPLTDKLDDCTLDYQHLVYKNDPEKLYLACGKTLILKASSGEYLGSTPYIPLAPVTADSKEFYAIQNKDLLSWTGSTNYSYVSYYLIKINQAFELASVHLIQEFDQSVPVNFILNKQTGLFYLATRSADYKAPDYAVYGFNSDGTAGQRLTTINALSGVNETTKQIYGATTNLHLFLAPDQIAVGASDSEQKAAFRWAPLAIDQKNNLVYATYFAGLDHDGGLSLLVMNGNTFSLARFIQVRAPETAFSDYAKPLAQLPINFQGQFFPQTGHTLTGKFLDYWNNNGGLARFGYPITEVFKEYDVESHQIHEVQYFERNRFELHPENAGTKYEVLLGLLGHNFSGLTGPYISGSFASGETEPAPNGGLLFKETGHTLSGKFLDYWNNTGGLAQHGLPLTEPTEEVNPIDGKNYLVQYFERSRLELHPENAGTQYEVLMGLLGTQTLRASGWSV